MSTIQISSIEKRHGRAKLNMAGAMTAWAVVFTLGLVGTAAPWKLSTRQPALTTKPRELGWIVYGRCLPEFHAMQKSPVG